MATVRIDLQSDLKRLDSRVQLLTDQNLRYMAARALNAAGGAAKQSLRQAMPRFIDKPVPYTVNSAFQRFAKAGDLTTTIGIADQSRTGRTPAAKYLQPIVKGTTPSLKGADLSATKIAGVSRGAVLIPARNSGLKNAAGNVSLSKYATILGEARKGDGRYYMAPVKRGSSTMAVFERTSGFIPRTSTVETTVRRMFTIDPNPKTRRRQLPLRQVLEDGFASAWRRELAAAYDAEVKRRLGGR